MKKQFFCPHCRINFGSRGESRRLEHVFEAHADVHGCKSWEEFLEYIQDSPLRFKTLVSPTRGETYTAADAVRKLLKRRTFYVDDWYVRRWEAPYAADFDGYVHIETETAVSLWTESISARVVAEIPFHLSNAGRYTFGEYGSHFPFPNKPHMAYWDEPRQTRIEACLDEDEEKIEVIEFTWDPNTLDPVQQETQDLLVQVVKEVLIHFALSSECEKCEPMPI